MPTAAQKHAAKRKAAKSSGTDLYSVTIATNNNVSKLQSQTPSSSTMSTMSASEAYSYLQVTSSQTRQALSSNNNNATTPPDSNIHDAAIIAAAGTIKLLTHNHVAMAGQISTQFIQLLDSMSNPRDFYLLGDEDHAAMYSSLVSTMLDISSLFDSSIPSYFIRRSGVAHLPSEETEQLQKAHSKFLTMAISWDSKAGNTYNGHKSLHLANTVCQKHLYKLALLTSLKFKPSESIKIAVSDPGSPLNATVSSCLSSYVFAEDPKGIIDFCLHDVCQHQGSGPYLKGSVTRDVGFAHATLRFLLLKNVRDCVEMHKLFEENFTKKNGTPKDEKHLSRYVGFSIWLCKVCQHGGTSSASLFKWLEQSFRVEINSFGKWGWESMVAGIGKGYFGVKPPPSMIDMITGMMGNMGNLGGMMQGMQGIKR